MENFAPFVKLILMLLSMVFAQIKGLEGEMKPLKDGVQSLTSQKDALLAEKTALKNEASLAHQSL